MILSGRRDAMEWEQRSIKLCAGMLLFAVMLRFVAGGGLIPIG